MYTLKEAMWKFYVLFCENLIVTFNLFYKKPAVTFQNYYLHEQFRTWTSPLSPLSPFSPLRPGALVSPLKPFSPGSPFAPLTPGGP